MICCRYNLVVVVVVVDLVVRLTAICQCVYNVTMSLISISVVNLSVL